MSTDTIDLINTVITLSMAIIPLVKDVIVKGEPRKNIFKEITYSGYLLIFLAFTIVGLTYWKNTILTNQREAVETKTELAQKSLNDSVQVLHGQLNNVNNTQVFVSGHLISIDSLLKRKKQDERLKEPSTENINPPILDIIPDGNPVIKPRYKGDSDVLLIMVSELIENAVASDIVSKFAIVTKKANGLTYEGRVSLFPSGIAYKQKGMYLSFPLNIRDFQNDTIKTYACIKITYTDKKNGATQPPLIKIYTLTKERDTRLIAVYDHNEYDKIITFLKSKKIF